MKLFNHLSLEWKIGLNQMMIKVGIYNTKNIKYKTTMLKSSLWDYSDVYILVKGTITVVGQRADTAVIAPDRNDKEVILKNCAMFSNRISTINNIQVDNAKDLHIVMAIYNLIEYIYNYTKNKNIFGNIVETIL